MTRSNAAALSRLTDLLRLLHEDLDRLSYYNLLGVPPDADDELIRQAFQGRSLWLHPDRHLQTAEPELREKISALYRRITEAYRVLGRPADRAAYDSLLAIGVLRHSAEAVEALAARVTGTSRSSGGAAGDGPRGAGGSRGSGAAAQTAGGEPIQSVQARQLFDMSKVSIKKMEFERAVTLLEQALGVEPKSRRISDALDEARRLKKMYGG